MSRQILVAVAAIVVLGAALGGYFYLGGDGTVQEQDGAMSGLEVAELTLGFVEGWKNGTGELAFFVICDDPSLGIEGCEGLGNEWPTHHEALMFAYRDMHAATGDARYLESAEAEFEYIEGRCGALGLCGTAGFDAYFDHYKRTGSDAHMRALVGSEAYWKSFPNGSVRGAAMAAAELAKIYTVNGDGETLSDAKGLLMETAALSDGSVLQSSLGSVGPYDCLVQKTNMELFAATGEVYYLEQAKLFFDTRDVVGSLGFIATTETLVDCAGALLSLSEATSDGGYRSDAVAVAREAVNRFWDAPGAPKRYSDYGFVVGDGFENQRKMYDSIGMVSILSKMKDEEFRLGGASVSSSPVGQADVGSKSEPWRCYCCGGCGGYSAPNGCWGVRTTCTPSGGHYYNCQAYTYYNNGAPCNGGSGVCSGQSCVPVCNNDGVCGSSETGSNCPSDCDASCTDDGICSAKEPLTCGDCSGIDKDGVCEAGESGRSPVDCPSGYSVSLDPSAGNANAGDNKTVNVSLSLSSGSAYVTSLSASGVPAGAGVVFSPPSCTPSCYSNATITTSGAAAGSYNISFDASAGGTLRSAVYNLTVLSSSLTCGNAVCESPETQTSCPADCFTTASMPSPVTPGEIVSVTVEFDDFRYLADGKVKIDLSIDGTTPWTASNGCNIGGVKLGPTTSGDAVAWPSGTTSEDGHFEITSICTIPSSISSGAHTLFATPTIY